MEVITTQGRKSESSRRSSLQGRQTTDAVKMKLTICFCMMLSENYQSVSMFVYCVFTFLDKPCTAEVMCVASNLFMCVELNLFMCVRLMCAKIVYWIQPSLYVLLNPSNIGYMLSKLLYRKSGDQVLGRQGGLGPGAVHDQEQVVVFFLLQNMLRGKNRWLGVLWSLHMTE
jgi:hypothetical protein